MGLAPSKTTIRTVSGCWKEVTRVLATTILKRKITTFTFMRMAAIAKVRGCHCTLAQKGTTIRIASSKSNHIVWMPLIQPSVLIGSLRVGVGERIRRSFARGPVMHAILQKVHGKAADHMRTGTCKIPSRDPLQQLVEARYREHWRTV